MSGAPTPGPTSTFDSFARSPLARVLSILLLLLVLRIPVGMVRGLIEERQDRRDQAREEVTGKWGREQSIVGPLLVVPYKARVTSVTDAGERTRFVERRASFLPESLSIEGDAASEVLRRGIFEVPVYATRLRLSGHFAAPDFSGFDAESDQIAWEQAEISLAISDPRVIQASVALGFDGQTIPFEAGPGRGRDAPGIHAPVSVAPASGADFDFEIELHGSSGLFFAPFGRETTVTLASDWPHPSFQGQWLPAERSVTAAGFEAEWHIPYLGRSYPQRWTSVNPPGDHIDASRFGVAFDTPIDPYRLSERSVKYDALFLGLTFLSLWLFEVLVGVRVHAVQYGLVGAAMTLFYLLLLALSEQIGFGMSYGIAAGGIVLLIATYAIATLGQRRRGLAIGGVVTSLYAYLYVLLHNQDHALLAGSVGLFAILALVMWLTRRVDWHQPLPTPARAPR